MKEYEIIFESDNLYYVKLSTLLIDDYLNMVNDKSIQVMISKELKKFTYDDEVLWVNNKLINNEEIYSIIEKETLAFVGNIELMDVTDKDCVLGICITNKYQNRHYGSEAIARIIEYAKNNLGLSEMKLVVYSNNERAIHCYEKMGFVVYNRDFKVKKVDEAWVDDIHMKKEI